MADSDYNMIKPVEGLPNIGGLTPAQRRKERKQQQNTHKQSKEKTEEQPNESVEQQVLHGELTENESSQNTIDYRA